MKLKFEPNKISFDEAGFRNEIFGIVRRGLDKFEEDYLQQMADIIDDVDTAHYFKDVVKSMLKHIGEEIVGGVITYVAGFDAGGDPADTMKAYVIAYGMGSKGKTGVPITAGPPGRKVWDSWLDGYKVSDGWYPGSRVAGTTGPEMPETWNHAGINFVEEATKIMRVHFIDMLEDVFSALPPNIVSKHIKVG